MREDRNSKHENLNLQKCQKIIVNTKTLVFTETSLVKLNDVRSITKKNANPFLLQKLQILILRFIRGKMS